MKKVFLSNVEFYITNVCNYNCDNCNRLNNFYFSGHQYWKDYQLLYKQWSEKINLGRIAILGGEPLLNPSILEWITGLRKLWPETKEFSLLTNGTRLEHWPELYTVAEKNRLHISIQLHNRNRYNNMVEYLKTKFFKTSELKFNFHNQTCNGWVEIYNLIRGKNWPDCCSVTEFKNLPGWIQDECTYIHKIDPESFMIASGGVSISDNNLVNVNLEFSEDFWTSPLQYSGQNTFDVYDSDPVKAHNICPSKHCYHFIRGKLYKCPHVAVLPEFIEQFHVNLTRNDAMLLASYQPSTVEQSLGEIETFIQELPNVIPQCKLCPENLTTRKIESSTKKIKILKKEKTIK